MSTTNFFYFFFIVFQLYKLLVSSYLVRNCYTVCACFYARARTFQVRAIYDPIRARHDSTCAYLLASPCLLPYRPH